MNCYVKLENYFINHKNAKEDDDYDDNGDDNENYDYSDDDDGDYKDNNDNDDTHLDVSVHLVVGMQILQPPQCLPRYEGYLRLPQCPCVCRNR